MYARAAFILVALALVTVSLPAPLAPAGTASASVCRFTDEPEDLQCWVRQVECYVRSITENRYCLD